MRRLPSRPTSRPAFTLIELLVVIAIIAILVSLTAAGVMRTLYMIPQIQTRNDISEFDTSLASFMSDFQQSVPPPSMLILDETMAYNGSSGNAALEARSKAFLISVFGKNINGQMIDWNGDGTAGNGKWTLEGEQCLIFYTGGIPGLPGTTPQPKGFSSNSFNPALFNGGRTYGPYMTFNSGRLVQTASNFYVYIDGWNVKGSQKPYAYFSSFGINNMYSADCPTISATPYSDGAGHFTNSNRYQIISAGQDGVFGNGIWTPSTGATGNGRDDQANFSGKVLGAAQQ